MSGRTATMRITVLAVPDCPNAPVAAGRITAALAGRPASVELAEVTGEAEAARLGMTGSPAILLDGVDPFAAAGAVPSASCRIYPRPDRAAARARPRVADPGRARGGGEGREGGAGDPGRAGRGGGPPPKGPGAGGPGPGPRRPGPHPRLAARRHGGVRRQPQLLRPGGHRLLR